jgi:hypothetical protein
MSFEHKQFALNGLFPGCKHWDIAVFGQFSIEVTVTPVSSGGYSPYFPAEDYLVTVKITTKKGKVYEQSFYASASKLRGFEKVVATFKGFKSTIVNVVASLNSVIRTKIGITIKRKH